MNFLRRTTKKWTLKSWLLFSTLLAGNFYTIFWGSEERIDMYLLIEYTRREDFAWMYAGITFNMAVLAYCLKKPKRISEDLKSFIFLVTIIDIIHYWTISKLYFGYEKIGVAIILFSFYKKRWYLLNLLIKCFEKITRWRK